MMHCKRSRARLDRLRARVHCASAVPSSTRGACPRRYRSESLCCGLVEIARGSCPRRAPRMERTDWDANKVKAMWELKKRFDEGELSESEFNAAKAPLVQAYLAGPSPPYRPTTQDAPRLAPASTDIRAPRPSLLVALPADVLERVCVGVPLGSLPALTATCRAARRCVEAKTFFATRLAHGYAERALLIVTSGFIPAEYYDVPMFNCPRPIEVRQPEKIKCRSRAFGPYVDFPIDTSAPWGGGVGRECVSHQAWASDGHRIFFTFHSIGNLPGRWTAIWMVDANGPGFCHFADVRALHADGSTPRRKYCMDWFENRLIIAGGEAICHPDGETQMREISIPYASFHAYDETTQSWDKSLPDMPLAVADAASGVIGHELYIAGGYVSKITNQSLELQIYSSRTKTWRFGQRLPEVAGATGHVVDGKFFVIGNPLFYHSYYVYSPATQRWTKESLPNLHGKRRRTCDLRDVPVCVHDDRLVYFQNNGAAHARNNDGSWSKIENLWTTHFVKERLALGLRLDASNFIGPAEDILIAASVYCG